eukprot:15351105-Ditylum_brightwellii.AAC.1
MSGTLRQRGIAKGEGKPLNRETSIISRPKIKITDAPKATEEEEEKIEGGGGGGGEGVRV